MSRTGARSTVPEDSRAPTTRSNRSAGVDLGPQAEASSGESLQASSSGRWTWSEPSASAASTAARASAVSTRNRSRAACRSGCAVSAVMAGQSGVNVTGRTVGGGHPWRNELTQDPTRVSPCELGVSGGRHSRVDPASGTQRWDRPASDTARPATDTAARPLPGLCHDADDTRAARSRCPAAARDCSALAGGHRGRRRTRWRGSRVGSVPSSGMTR
jgi:hypothetical protein